MNILFFGIEKCIFITLCSIIHHINSNFQVFHAKAVKEALLLSVLNTIDIFILDVQANSHLGMDIAKYIRKMDIYKLTPIIYINGLANKELEAYRLVHCYAFVSAPFDEKIITSILRDLSNRTTNKNGNVLTLKCKNYTHIVNENHIIYIERKDRKLIIVTIDKEITYSSCCLSKMHEQLSENFIRCHQGFIINKLYIKNINHAENSICLNNIDCSIPIGRKYKPDIIKNLNLCYK